MKRKELSSNCDWNVYSGLGESNILRQFKNIRIKNIIATSFANEKNNITLPGNLIAGMCST